MPNSLGISLFLVALVLSFALNSICQTAPQIDNVDLQSWNDVQVTLPLNKSADLLFGGTLQFGKNVTRIQEEKLGVGVVLKPTHDLSFIPLFAQVKVRSFTGVIQSEYRIYLRGTYHFPIKHFGLSYRSQYEYRFRAIRNTWRFSPSVNVEKALPESLAAGLKLFANEEPIYDSAAKRFSRNRLSLGVTKTLSKKVSVDFYYLRQDDNFTHPWLIHAIGTSWKIKLDGAK